MSFALSRWAHGIAGFSTDQRCLCAQLPGTLQWPRPAKHLWDCVLQVHYRS